MTYICQHCHAHYDPDVARASGIQFYICFCGGRCQTAYVAEHGRLPPIGAETPLGKPETCNLQATSPPSTDAVRRARRALLGPRLRAVAAGWLGRDDTDGELVALALEVAALALELDRVEQAMAHLTSVASLLTRDVKFEDVSPTMTAAERVTALAHEFGVPGDPNELLGAMLHAVAGSVVRGEAPALAAHIVNFVAASLAAEAVAGGDGPDPSDN